ncbi:peroxisomal membrane protein 11A-like [Lepus europaeus]|uniref:peroxisomal membrane protein 11A-like n=1 Tax=Lepus europaeus TaxID=9983 RepID=UPI002B472A3D|nr:peroxisomal membrane protein 11A-like [Lepus europaeus]
MGAPAARGIYSPAQEQSGRFGGRGRTEPRPALPAGTPVVSRGLGWREMQRQSALRDPTKHRRATQYTRMLLTYLLEPKAGKEEVVMKLKKLESRVSTGRKWFRLGNVVHAVQATEQSIRATNPVPRLCLTLANLNRVIYFVCDTVLWVKSVGLASGINKDTWRRRAARHYCCFLLLSLVRDVYEISLQMGRVACDRARREESSSWDLPAYSVADEETEWLQSFLLLFRSLKHHAPLLLDTVKNFCDILIPLDQLGIYKPNTGIIGLGGLMSSVAGIITVAYPQMKLRTR